MEWIIMQVELVRIITLPTLFIEWNVRDLTQLIMNHPVVPSASDTHRDKRNLFPYEVTSSRCLSPCFLQKQTVYDFSIRWLPKIACLPLFCIAHKT